jgi:DNA-binding response OmpR family regulator
MTRHVLVIEDHEDIRNLVALHLRDMHCHVTLAQDGPGGLKHAKDRSYDLMVLDWMLPGISGIDICHEMRDCKNQTPILMLSANLMENHRIVGLDAGADDYMTKPFSVLEFQARVRAIFRRNDAVHESSGASTQRVLLLNDLSIDADQRLVHLGNKLIDLTAKEFDLLCYLARHQGQVFNRQQLLDAIWGTGFDGFEHTVNSHINRLRAKIEKNHGEPEYIVTIWGVGYKMPDFHLH